MKKIILFLLAILFITGCEIGTEMSNSPTKRVENYLDSYQSLDDNILNDLDTLLVDLDYTVAQKDSYRELMKNHYQNLKYEIKDETINGDKATVTAEIEVIDYSKTLKEEPNQDLYLDDEGNYDEGLFYDYQLNKMKETKEKVKYTIVFNLTKVNDDWAIDELDNTTKEKIHGIYVY